MSCPPHPRESGFTLIELVVVSAVLALLSVSLLAIFSSSGVAVAEMNASSRIDSHLLRVIERLHAELDFADPGQVTLVDPQTLTFEVVEGWNGYAPLLGPMRTLTFASGHLAIDGDVYVENVSDGQMTLDDERLEIEFTVHSEYIHDGSVAPLLCRRSIQHRFGD